VIISKIMANGPRGEQGAFVPKGGPVNPGVPSRKRLGGVECPWLSGDSSVSGAWRRWGPARRFRAVGGTRKQKTEQF